jgi:DNA-binding transcriptional ArsR family regulator
MPQTVYVREMSVFDVLAEPNRRRILDVLQPRECSVGQLVDRLDLSQPAVSKHLRILREAGLVDVRVDAQRRLYRVRPEPLRAMDEWLAPYRRMWASRLEDLERHLDEMDSGEGADDVRKPGTTR